MIYIKKKNFCTILMISRREKIDRKMYLSIYFIKPMWTSCYTRLYVGRLDFRIRIYERYDICFVYILNYECSSCRIKPKRSRTVFFPTIIIIITYYKFCFFFACYSYIGFIVQRVSHHERLGDLVLDELRKVRTKHCICAVLFTTGRILGDTGNSVECRQLRTWAGNHRFTFS